MHRHRSSSLLLLRRQRAGESDALHSPGLERSLRGDRLAINPKPALHLVRASQRSRTGLGEESLGLLGAVDSLCAVEKVSVTAALALVAQDTARRPPRRTSAKLTTNNHSRICPSLRSVENLCP